MIDARSDLLMGLSRGARFPPWWGARRKMLQNSPREPLFSVSEKAPQNSCQISRQISLPKIKKFTDELLQERKENLSLNGAFRVLTGPSSDLNGPFPQLPSWAVFPHENALENSLLRKEEAFLLTVGVFCLQLPQGPCRTKNTTRSKFTTCSTFSTAG